MPGTPRTRYKSSSVRAFTSSKYCVLRSITQRLASDTSMIWLVVRRMIPAKIELWCDIRKVENATAKMRPRYLARSPRSICTATKFIEAPFLNDYWIVNTVHQLRNFFGPVCSSFADPFDQDVDHAINQAILLNERERARDQQGRDAVDAGPKSLRYLLDIFAIQLSCLDAASDCGAKIIEAA